MQTQPLPNTASSRFLGHKKKISITDKGFDKNILLAPSLALKFYERSVTLVCTSEHPSDYKD